MLNSLNNHLFCSFKFTFVMFDIGRMVYFLMNPVVTHVKPWSLYRLHGNAVLLIYFASCLYTIYTYMIFIQALYFVPDSDLTLFKKQLQQTRISRCSGFVACILFASRNSSKNPIHVCFSSIKKICLKRPEYGTNVRRMLPIVLTILVYHATPPCKIMSAHDNRNLWIMLFLLCFSFLSDDGDNTVFRPFPGLERTTDGDLPKLLFLRCTKQRGHYERRETRGYGSGTLYILVRKIKICI